MKKTLQNISLAFSTFFYVGFFPVAQGTVGSLAALGVMVAFGFYYPEISPFFNAFLAIAGLILGGAAVQVVLNTYFKQSDPGQIVIDEVAGMAITLSFVGFTKDAAGIFTYVFAFIMFRVFDVWKPSIIGRIDKSHAKHAVMLDDIAAGVFAWCFVMPLHLLLNIFM